MEGAQMLKESVETFLRDNPKPEEKVMARMTELAHHLESDKLKMQAGQIIGRCSEVDEMIKKKLKTINGAEKRFQVGLLAFFCEIFKILLIHCSLYTLFFLSITYYVRVYPKQFHVNFRFTCKFNTLALAMILLLTLRAHFSVPISLHH